MTTLDTTATITLVLIIITFIILSVYILVTNKSSTTTTTTGNSITGASGVPPTAPVNLQSINLTSSSAELTWQPVSTAQQYTVLYQIVNSPTWVQYYTGTATDITVNNLTPYAMYNFGVLALNNYGQSSTTVVSIQLPGPNSTGGAPSSPSNFKTGNTTSTSAVLSWTPGTGSSPASQYNILYQIVGSATSDWVDFATVSATTTTVTGLIANVPYNFGVTAINNYGTSAMTLLSNFEISSTPSGVAPVSPTGLTVSASDSDSVTLTWVGVATAVQYQVLYQVNGSTSWIEFSNTPSATIVVTGLLSQIPYNFSVCAMNNYGFSSPSIISNVQLVPSNPRGSISPPPTKFQCAASVSTATLTWVAPTWTDLTDPIHYQILYQVVGSSSWITLPLTMSTTTTIKNLLPYVMYNFELIAIDNYGASSSVSVDEVLIPGPANSETVPTPPSNLVLINSDSDSVTLQWTSVSNAVQYQILYQVLGSATTPDGWTEYAVTSATNITILGLSSYVPYNFSVCGINNIGIGNSSLLTNVQLLPPVSVINLPSYPSVVQAINLTPSSATVTWSSVINAAQYQVQYQVSGSSDWIEYGIFSGTSATILNLSPYVPYNFSVTAINNSGNSVPGSVINVALPGPPNSNTAPATPTGLQSSNITVSSVNLAWSPVSGAIQYQVQYQIAGSSTWTEYQLTNSTNCSITGLSSYVTYNLSVIAINNYGNSSAGTLNGVTMLGSNNVGPVPSAVANLQAGTITGTSVPLTWSSVTNAAQYQVQYQVQGSPSTPAGWVEWQVISGTNVTITGLLNYVTYNFSVTAINNYGASPASTVTGIQIPGPSSSGTAPATPINFQYGTLTSTTAPLSWVANSSGSGTPIQYEVSYQVVGSASNAWALYGVTTNTSITVTGLVPSTQYNFSVIAINNYGASTGGLINNVLLPSANPVGSTPATPTNLACSATTTNSITLTWTSVTTATQYTVAYQITGSASNSWAQIGNTTNSNVTINNLASGSSYNFIVTAINNYGSSVPATLSGIQTTMIGSGGSVPKTPTGLAVISTTPTSATMTWNTSSDAIQYAVNYQTSGSGTSWVEFGTTNNTSMTVTGLIAYATYNFSVVAVNNYGTSPQLTVTSIALPSSGGSGSVPSTPLGFTISGSPINTNSMLFQWNSVTGATQYLFAYKITSGTQWYDIAVSTTSILIDTLVANYSYSFSVSAINTSGTSAPSVLNNVNILANVTGLSKASSTLSWNPVTGANNYIVGYSGPKTYTGVTDPTISWVYVPTSTTSISTSSLSGSPYSFYVYAQNTVTTTAGFGAVLMNAT
jgi:hypothetical protein